MDVVVDGVAVRAAVQEAAAAPRGVAVVPRRAGLGLIRRLAAAAAAARLWEAGRAN